MNQVSSSESKIPKTARGRRTRDKILVAAEQVFGEVGFGAASIGDITRRAGTAQGSFYTYFDSKKEAFTELVRHLSRELRTTLAEAARGAEDRLDAERKGMIAFFSFIAEHRSLYRIVRQAEFVDEDLYRWYYRQIADGYVRGLAEAAKRGEIADLDPDTLAWSLMGMADFLGMRWVLWEGKAPPDHVVDAAIELVRAGLMPR